MHNVYLYPNTTEYTILLVGALAIGFVKGLEAYPSQGQGKERLSTYHLVV